MVFATTRVDLCGVRICDGEGSGLMRAILDTLREQNAYGFIALSGDELARRVGHTVTGQNNIADAVRRLRERIEKALLEEASIQCNSRSIITNDRRHGYRLSNKITIRDAGSPPQKIDPLPTPHQTSIRQEWILHQLATQGPMQKAQLFQGYASQHHLSKTTLDRDLKALKRKQKIHFQGNSRTGHWQLV